MKDSKCGCDCVKNVGCQVTNCKYHGLLNRCTAEQITVQNENAMKKGETYCATFVPKSQD